MPDLSYYLQMWNLTDPQPLAVTGTSHLYTAIWREETVVLKLLTPVGLEDEKHSAQTLIYFGGLSSIRLLGSDDGAQLLEYAGGEDLKALVQRGEDEQATSIIVDVLNALHRPHRAPVPDDLTPLKQRFRSLFAKAKRDADEKASLYISAARVAEKLLSNQQDGCVLHGDMHHENVKHSAERGWLAIDPKGLLGERTYDAANVLCNPTGMDAFVSDQGRLMKHADILALGLKIDIQRLIAFTFAHACLSASWSLEDNQDPTLALKIASILEPQIADSIL